MWGALRRKKGETAGKQKKVCNKRGFTQRAGEEAQRIEDGVEVTKCAAMSEVESEVGEELEVVLKELALKRAFAWCL